MWPWIAVGIVVFMLLSLVLVMFWREGGPPRWEAGIDPRGDDGAFVAHVRNLGGRPRDPYCRIYAFDVDGTRIGTDGVIITTLGPGERWEWRGDIEVTGPVASMEISCH